MKFILICLLVFVSFQQILSRSTYWFPHLNAESSWQPSNDYEQFIYDDNDDDNTKFMAAEESQESREENVNAGDLNDFLDTLFGSVLPISDEDTDTNTEDIPAESDDDKDMDEKINDADDHENGIQFEIYMSNLFKTRVPDAAEERKDGDEEEENKSSEETVAFNFLDDNEVKPKRQADVEMIDMNKSSDEDKTDGQNALFAYNTMPEDHFGYGNQFFFNNGNSNESDEQDHIDHTTTAPNFHAYDDWNNNNDGDIDEDIKKIYSSNEREGFISCGRKPADNEDKLQPDTEPSTKQLADVHNAWLQYREIYENLNTLKKSLHENESNVIMDFFQFFSKKYDEETLNRFEKDFAAYHDNMNKIQKIIDEIQTLQTVVQFRRVLQDAAASKEVKSNTLDW